MFGFPTATLLDCHGRYAQNVAFFNVMTEAHKYDHSEATGSSSWDFQSSFRREKLEQKSPDSKTLQEDSPGVRQKVYDCQECGKSFRQKGESNTDSVETLLREKGLQGAGEMTETENTCGSCEFSSQHPHGAHNLP
ncbi:zinc finger protein 32 isoform X3 [Onychomys torridus]|uniref:zinc finger protein 32 isoform X3 n=1 Tax=Onychomys torridus TaxID=38674 RepID=UPI00167FBD2C|nr:zinc finger protein 32 isoform X3 [Onychomys torridus]